MIPSMPFLHSKLHHTLLIDSKPKRIGVQKADQLGQNVHELTLAKSKALDAPRQI